MASHITRAAIALVAVLVAAGSAHAACDSTWSDGNSNWNNAGNWSPSGVPNSSSINVCITDGTSAVNLDIGASVGNLSLASGNTLSLLNGTSLAADGGTVANAGLINVNGGSGSNTFFFAGAGTTTLSGGGTVTLNVAGGGGSTFVRQSAGGVTLLNQDNLIQGAGSIGDDGLALSNGASGTVNANASGQTLDVNSGNGGVTNAGLLTATGGGTLALHNGIANAGGNITAGSGGTVNLSGASVAGGTLNTTGGGLLQTVGGATLNGITLSSGSTYTGSLGSSTHLAGTITNNGTFQINGGGGSNTFLFADSSTTTLQGGGTITLNVAAGGGSTFVRQGAGGVTLLNQDNLIQGAGSIGDDGLAVNNQATISANASGQTLDVNAGNGGVTNTGLLTASGGGTLALHNGITNAGGNITAGSGGTVNLGGASVAGGTLNTTGGGLLQTVGGATLNGVTLSSGSTYTGSLGSSTHLAGTITNNGTFQINGGGGSNTFLYADTGTTTLSGGGTVTLNVAAGGGNTFVRQGAGGVTLLNQDNLIQGAGSIGDDGLAVNNQATINANASGQTLDVNAGNGGVANTGLLTATGGGTLALHNGIANTGGNITADIGSTVNLGGASVAGGTLNTVGSGLLQTAGNATLNSVTLSAGSTYTGSLGSSTHLANTITNNGTFQINGGGGSNTFLFADTGTTTLSGGGTVTLNVASGGGSTFVRQAAGGVTLLNQDNLIQGAGSIGDDGLAVNNQATINANASGQTLDVNAGNGGVTNTGLLTATGGGTLALHNGIANAGGNITAGTGGTVNVNNASVAGGTLNTSGGGLLQTTGSATLNGITLSSGSTYTGSLGSSTHLAGTITNNGTFQINGGGGFNTFLYADTSTTTLTGGGTVTLNVAAGGGSLFVRQSAGGVTLLNQDNLIQGTGSIGDDGMAFSNGALGTVNANAFGQTLQIGAGNGGVSNNGTFAAQAGSLLQIAGGGGSFSNFSGNTLTGGTYQVFGTASNAGTMQLNPLGSSGGEIVNNAASILLDGPNSNLVDAAGLDALANFTNNTAAGSFTIQNGRNFNAPSAFSNAGAVRIGGGSNFGVSGGTANYNQSGGSTRVDGGLAAATTTVSGGLLFGVGTVSGDLNNVAGTVHPGDTIGQLSVTGNYIQGTSGILDVALGGTTGGTGYSQLLVGLGATLSGTLALDLVGGFHVSNGDTFDIVGTGEGLTNDLSSLTLDGTACTADGGGMYTCTFGSFFDIFTELTLPGTLVGGTAPQDLVLEATVVPQGTGVPEPGSLMLLGAGLIALYAGVRRGRPRM